MENNEFKEMCADFRQANRIVALIQGRIRDIVFYVKSQTRFRDAEIVGIKLFSKELANKNNKNGELKLWYNMWPWDFIYSYVFEYRFFDSKGVMSIIQISDDGFSKISDCSNWHCIKDYYPVEESNSWLIFSYSEGKEKIPWENVKNWEDGVFFNEGKKVVAKRYDMSLFCNESEINNQIADFDKIVTERLGKAKTLTKNS